jgi:hypothetical protein
MRVCGAPDVLKKSAKSERIDLSKSLAQTVHWPGMGIIFDKPNKIKDCNIIGAS